MATRDVSREITDGPDLTAVGIVLSTIITPSREALAGGAWSSGPCGFRQVCTGAVAGARHFDDAGSDTGLANRLGVSIGRFAAVNLGKESQGAHVIDNPPGSCSGILGGGVARCI